MLRVQVIPRIQAALAVLVMSAPVWAQAEPVSADVLFNRGVEQMRAGQFKAGCPLIAESQRIDPTPGTLYTLAECEARAGTIASAVTHYKEYLQIFAGMTGTQRLKHQARSKNAEAQIAAIEPEVPTLKLVVPKDAPAGTKVTYDGTKLELVENEVVVPVNPGEHVIVTQLPNGVTYKQEVVIKEKGARYKLVVQVRPKNARKAGSNGSMDDSAPPDDTLLQRDEPAAPNRPWQKPVGISAVALGGVGIVVGAVLGGLAISTNDESNRAHCLEDRNLCTGFGTELRNLALDRANGSTASIILGSALLAGGVVLIATAPKTPTPERAGTRTSWNAQLEVGFGAARITGTW